MQLAQDTLPVYSVAAYHLAASHACRPLHSLIAHKRLASSNARISFPC